ncbi:alpha-glucosidase [Halyomorpha halys]|uniref:alpha-glucosidase n=1 Tax=Halyomorpha halys TaxID=286706 RepID=UPI0006D50CF5|nr:alpha-glucosidase-like [Halyomorpha halys]
MILPALICLFLHLANADDIPWWKSNVLYQVYPRSFADSDGDGNGDIKGIIQHVQYLHDIGIGTIWLSPIYASPWKDMGYDISDYRQVNPLYGTVADVEALIKEIHKFGMKIFLDLVPNHTSDEHPWFNASRYKVDGKDDYYVWKDPKGWDGSKPLPPSNWMSIFGGSAWTYDDVRKQFYLHQFGSYQPDLNYRNKQVVNEMQQVMKFWFDKGLDGFRVDAIPYYVEDAEFRDEERKPNCHLPLEADCLIHNYTENLPETYEVMREFDDFLKQYDGTENPKYFFLEAYATLEQTVKYNMPHSSAFNFEVIQKFHKDNNATELKSIIDAYMAILPNETWPNWVVGNHDNSRIGSKLGPELVDGFNMMILMLPGASVTYYGEEIGMLDTYVRPSRLVDDTGRDPERTPMQWSNKKNAGFSNASTTWLPVNPNYYKINVEDELKTENSHLNKYKRLVEVRKNFIGSKDLVTATFGDWVFAFKRKNGNHEYYVIINFNDIEESVDLKSQFDKIPGTLYVHTPSQNALYNVGDKVDTSAKLTIHPRSALGLSAASSTSLTVSLGIIIGTLWLFIFSNRNFS